MQTISRISGMSLPMPAHLVLMSSLQSLRSDDELLQKVFASSPPSPQGSHHPLFLLPCVVTTELLYVGGAEVRHTKGLHNILGPFS